MKVRKLSIVLGVGATVAIAGTTLAGASGTTQDWPYAPASGPSYTLAAVGDIACEPNDPQNLGNPVGLRCGGSTLGGFAAEFATAKQAEDMQPDAVALLGDEQYQVGKLSDFEDSFDQAWGGLKFLEHPSPGNHEYYAYTKKGDNEPANNGNGYFAYFNGHDISGTPNMQGQAGDDTAGTQGWYSYNLGNWHIISLNAECNSAPFGNDCSTTDGSLLSQETQWLADDLRNNDNPCVMAYWHQPTFSTTAAPTATVPASAPGAGGPEGFAADAWWKLLYKSHATLILNGHEHLYARLKPMDPTGKVDPTNGIPEFIIGSGGESLDAWPTGDTSSPNPNVITAQNQAFGVAKFTLKPGGYSFSYAPTLAGPGFGPSALNYSDSGSGTCNGQGQQ